MDDGPSPPEQFPQHRGTISLRSSGNNPVGSRSGPLSLMYGGMSYQLALIILGHLHFSENQTIKRRSFQRLSHFSRIYLLIKRGSLFQKKEKGLYLMEAAFPHAVEK